METNEKTKDRIIDKFVDECIGLLKKEVLPKDGIGQVDSKLKTILDSYLEEW